MHKSTNTTQCYIRREGKTLMLHRTKKKTDPLQDKWVAVGGKCEPGETPEECIRREVREETGLALRDLLLRGIITFVVQNTDESIETCCTFVFECSSFSGELITSNEGDLQWVTDTKLLELAILEKDRIFLPWIYKKKQIFSAKFFSRGKRLHSYHVTFYGAISKQGKERRYSHSATPKDSRYRSASSA